MLFQNSEKKGNRVVKLKKGREGGKVKGIVCNLRYAVIVIKTECFWWRTNT